MTLRDLDNYINQKINKNSEYIVFKFFELRVQFNLSEEDTEYVLYLAKQKLENNNYKVFFRGEKYTYRNKEEIVKDNELLVAIKV